MLRLVLVLVLSWVLWYRDPYESQLLLVWYWYWYWCWWVFVVVVVVVMVVEDPDSVSLRDWTTENIPKDPEIMAGAIKENDMC